MIDMGSRQARAAQLYMRHKGYKNVRPYEVDKVEGRPIWYFYYDLPDGDLELEVEWDPEDREWRWVVTCIDEKPKAALE